MADYSNLKQRAQEVRNETKAGANTADRVGYLLEEIVKAIEAEKLDTYHEDGTDAVSIAAQKNILLNITSADGKKVSELYLSAEEAVALIRVVSSAGTSLFRVDGGALTIQLPTSISINVPSLNLGNVRRIYGAYIDGLQTSGDININAKTRISATVDTGELKVLQGASNYGFILRTVTDPNNTTGLDLIELLSTDGYNSRKYTFPTHSGEVALKSDIPDVSGKQDRLRRYTEGEINFNGTIETRATTVADRVTLQNASNGATRINCFAKEIAATYSGDAAYCEIKLSDNGVMLQTTGEGIDAVPSVVLSPDGEVQVKGIVRLKCGGSAEISITPTGVSIAGATLDISNASRILGAVFNGLQTKGDININAKTTLSASIDPGELKVLHRGSPYGFILRTVDNPNDPNGLMIPELLSTDGYSSYKYTFPAQSGEVALKAELDALKARVAALEAKH